MDDINDQLNKLSRQLDTLDDTSAKYQVQPPDERYSHDVKETAPTFTESGLIK